MDETPYMKPLRRRSCTVASKAKAIDMEGETMQSDSHNRRTGRLWETLRRAGPLAAVVLGIALAIAACGGSSGHGVASLGRQTSSSGVSSSRATGGALAYSACMRSHGIKDFPDPNAQGDLQVQASSNSDLNPDNPAYEAANQACESLLPGPSAAQLAKALPDLLKFAACMRAHGIKDFPDPNAQGQLQIRARPNSDLLPSNPQFQAARNACQNYLPGYLHVAGQRPAAGSPSSSPGVAAGSSP